MIEPTGKGENEPWCLCNGIRFCALCENSERVRKLFEGQATLQDAATVIANQQSQGRTSSVSFALVGQRQRSLCIECGGVFDKPLVLGCSDHEALHRTGLVLSGVFVVKDFVSAAEEESLISFLDCPTEPFAPWQDSLSGRRKHEFGPKKNFKKKKVKPADLAAMPLALRPILQRVSTETERLTGTQYEIAEASALEYVEKRASNIDPHIDDTWLWGERIGGINLLEDCAMTFVNKDGAAVEVHLPRRCYFLMSGDSRYVWMHGIRPDSVKNRRVSITLRELSCEISANQAIARPILNAAANFL